MEDDEARLGCVDHAGLERLVYEIEQFLRRRPLMVGGHIDGLVEHRGAVQQVWDGVVMLGLPPHGPPNEADDAGCRSCQPLGVVDHTLESSGHDEAAGFIVVPGIGVDAGDPRQGWVQEVQHRASCDVECRPKVTVPLRLWSWPCCGLASSAWGGSAGPVER